MATKKKATEPAKKKAPAKKATPAKKSPAKKTAAPKATAERKRSVVKIDAELEIPNDLIWADTAPKTASAPIAAVAAKVGFWKRFFKRA